MGEFEDLDQFLNQQRALVTHAEKAVVNDIEKSRAEAQPLVKACIGTLAEYYKTILKPRTDLQVVKKKKEKPNIDPQRPYDPHYVYMVNFVPLDLPDGTSFYGDYSNPKRMGSNDWHPNVGLQFELELKDRYSREAQGVIGLSANIQLKVWGRVEADPKAITSKGFAFSYGSGWNKTYTTFSIYGDIDKPEVTAANLATVLIIATPQVLAHKKTIRGR